MRNEETREARHETRVGVEQSYQEGYTEEWYGLDAAVPHII